MIKLSSLRVLPTGEVLAFDYRGRPVGEFSKQIGQLVAQAAVDSGLEPTGAVIECSVIGNYRVVPEGKGWRVEVA